MLTPIEISPLDFLSAFYAPDETVFTRVFFDREIDKEAEREEVARANAEAEQKFQETGTPYEPRRVYGGGRTFSCKLTQWPTTYAKLQMFNTCNQPRGIFFTVNGGGQKDEEVKQIKAQFVEMDEESFDEQFARIEAFSLPPSIIVKTQKSLHCYWLMRGAELSRFRATQQMLIAHFNGCDKCINESRVMRIPGFYHNKLTPIMVECIKWNPELRYTQDELVAALPAVDNFPPEAYAFELPETIEKGSRDTTIFKYACSMQAKGYSDETILSNALKANEELCNPPLDESDVHIKVRSALRYPKGALIDVSAIAVPDYTAQDYTASAAPFEWLYQFKDDKFVIKQLTEQMKIKAGSVGVRAFMGLWKAFLETKRKQAGIVQENVTDFDGQPIELMCGEWHADEYGITAIDPTGREIKVCSHPILPVQRLTNIDTGAEKLKIAYRNGGRSWRTVTMDKRTLASASSIVALSDYGVGVNSETAKHLVRYLTDIEHLNYNQIPETNSIGRLGWIDGYGFAPYNIENMVFDGHMSFRHFFEAVQQQGAYTEWLSLVREVRKGGTIPRIALAASLASVLVKPCGALPFFVHLWGESGTGKTVSLLLAASVWANPHMGQYVVSMDNTVVAQELLAEFCNSLPLIMDEAQTNNDKMSLDKVVYRLSEGVNRGRGQKTGGLQKVGSWSNCIITSGERPLSSMNSASGVVNRIIDIDCNDTHIYENPAGVVELIKSNYGFAGRIFVEKLQQDCMLDLVKVIQRETMAELAEKDTTGKQAQAASILLTADALAEQWIFKDGLRLTTDDIAGFLASKNDVSVHERTLQYLYDCVAMNPHRFKSFEYQNDLWGKMDTEAGYVYFIKTKFDDLLKVKDFDTRAFLNWAKRKELLLHDENKNTRKARVPGFESSLNCVALKYEKEQGTEGTEGTNA